MWKEEMSMMWVCSLCPPTNEWHFTHADYAKMIPVFDREQLVRLVTAQQWAVAIAFWADSYDWSIRTGAEPKIAEAEAEWGMRRNGAYLAPKVCAVDVVNDLMGVE